MNKALLEQEPFKSILLDAVKFTEFATNQIDTLKERIADLEQKEDTYNETIDLLTEYIRHKKMIGDFEEGYVAKLTSDAKMDVGIQEMIQNNINKS